MDLQARVHEALPTTASNARTCHEIASKLWDHSEMQVRKVIKSLRASWVPISWNNKWSYITYNKTELAKKQKQIDNAKAWFAIGMNKIKNVYQWVIDKGLTTKTIG